VIFYIKNIVRSKGLLQGSKENLSSRQEDSLLFDKMELLENTETRQIKPEKRSSCRSRDRRVYTDPGSGFGRRLNQGRALSS